MKSKKLIITIALVIPLLFGACTACPTYYKDGGTVEYNYIVLKVIDWNSLSGKDYVETLIFPKSLLPVDFLYDREEKDFEALLKSAKAELEPLFDVEDTQSESRFFYRYEIFDVENKPIILEHSHELLNDSGGC